MGQFEDRKIKRQHTCARCKHSRTYDSWGSHVYCMLGVSDHDRNYVATIAFGPDEPNERFREIMKIKYEDGYLLDSPRLVHLDHVCQFFEKFEW